MKESVLKALKAKFQGVSDSMLERIAMKLSKTITTEEQVQSAVDEVSFQQILETYGDSRATEAQKTAIANYETKYGLKDGKVIEKQKDGQQDNKGGVEDVPAWAKSLIESNKMLSERLDKMDVDRTTTTRHQQLSKIIEKLPESLRKSYERTPVGNLTDEQFTSLVGEITTEVDGIVNDMNAKGAVFGKPSVSNTGKADGTLTNEQKAAISQRNGVAAEDGQPF